MSGIKRKSGVYKRTKEHKEKLKGRIPWNKGLTKETNEIVRKIGLASSVFKKGKKLSNSHKDKISKSLKDVIKTEKTRKKFAIAKSGKNCPFWKGGITKKNLIIRNGLKIKLWREKVFQRDDYKCQNKECKSRIKHKLQAHHIKSFSKYSKLRFDVDNGITFCEDCHKDTDNYGNKFKKLKVTAIK